MDMEAGKVKANEIREEIDFVITWVDGSDEAWNRQRREFRQNDMDDNCDERYRDWNLLKYWFRGVEQYAPWVRKIHFITWGHLPKWLNTENPKLHIVRHEDYIPEEYLPTFNSNVLELYLHKIEGLAEHFVYFNDDMFLTDRVLPQNFFCDGKPCDMLAFQPVVANPKNPVMSHLFLNNSLVLSKHFNKKECVRKYPGDYFKIGYPLLYFCYNLLELAFPLYTGFYTVHGPSPFCRSTYEELWEKEGELLKKVSGSRFRSEGDVTQYLFREWQKLSGNFEPKNIQKGFRYFEITHDNKKLADTIRKKRCRILCINDTWTGGELKGVKEQIQGAFEQILPQKSEFEAG